MAHIHTSPFDDVEIPNIPITEYVLNGALQSPEKVVLIDGPSGRSYTAQAFADAVGQLAGGLAEWGIAKGDVVAIMSPNIPEYAVVFHAILTAGGTATTLNPTYTAQELRHQLQDSGAVMMLTVEPVLAVAKEAVEGTSVRETFMMGGAVDDNRSVLELFSEAITQVEVDPTEHIAVLPYSSGTTGLSKGVMLTHRNLVANICQTGPIFEYTDDDVAFAALPFFHIYGMQVLMNALIAERVTVVSVPRFDLVEALELVQQHKITYFFAVPPMVLAFAKHPIIDNYDMSSVKVVFSGAAPLSGELGLEAQERIGATVVQGYGMTELSPVSHATPLGNVKPGSSGLTVANTECRIVDTDSGEDQGFDAEGELWVRGPQVMKGYFGNTEATDATVDADGWLHTGDVAKFDSDGHIYIVDRVKELIKYKGFQVPPAELEALLLTHPAIADAAVIGIADDEAGELPKAFVALQAGAEMTETDVQDFVKPQVATYKQIRLVEFIDEIPKSASGKILRRYLRNR